LSFNVKSFYKQLYTLDGGILGSQYSAELIIGQFRAVTQTCFLIQQFKIHKMAEYNYISTGLRFDTRQTQLVM